METTLHMWALGRRPELFITERNFSGIYGRNSSEIFVMVALAANVNITFRHILSSKILIRIQICLPKFCGDGSDKSRKIK
jgi:hypothetical protein